MSTLVALPVLLPLLTGALSLLFLRSRSIQRGLGVLAMAALLLIALALLAETWRHGHLVMYMGGWVAPFGITLISDLLAAIMVVLVLTI